ncbi:hypothetical protein [Pseudosulfitobacter sp. SM2401]|uniref:hypothetical protein n=1 Tax=Pseudosulfitobacter sp. SM2401 TaxID=3350098 RepID=UPI0036F33B0F
MRTLLPFWDHAIEEQVFLKVGTSMEFSSRWRRSFLFIGAMLAASLQGNAAFAGCMDGDYIKKAFAAQKTVKFAD